MWLSRESPRLFERASFVSALPHGLEPIWTAKPETASRVRGRIESVLDWATACGYRANENPSLALRRLTESSPI